MLLSGRDKRYVLRLYRLTPRAEITFELELVDFLANRHFPTPHVHRQANGELLVDVSGVPAALFDFAEGCPIDEADPGDVGRIAKLLARIHVLTSGTTFPGERSRTDVGRIRRLEVLAAANPGLGRRSGMAEFLAGIRSVLAEWGVALHSPGGPIPIGPIHHDPSPGNILVNQDGEITALVDFDEAYVGPLVFDIAALLHTWALDTSRNAPRLVRPERVHQLLRDYEAVRPLTMAERHLLPLAMLIFTGADAAEYLTRWWIRNPDEVNLDESLSLAAFRVLRESQEWLQHLNSP